MVRWGGPHAAAAVLACAAFASFFACGDNGPATLEQPIDASTPVDTYQVGQGVGQACSESLACRAGLVCNGTCGPGHASGVGTPCTLSDECTQGDYCGPARECTPAGTGAAGASCHSDADCASGMRCDLVGLTAQCQPEGSGDLGGKCGTSADCLSGLVCSAGACAAPPPTPGGVSPVGAPQWPGVTCTDDATPPVAAYFRVPRGSNDGDFFRLPFPNDVRNKGGQLDLTNFPTPGADILGFDLVGRYVTDVQATQDGFSTYPTITMRFSGSVDFGSLKKANALTWIEFDGQGGGTPIGFEWTATTGRNQYVCANSLSARPQPGLPLKPATTYAFIVTTDVVAADGSAIKVSDDLAALLASSAPSDSALAAAYDAYKPLRDWAPSNIPLARILDATVFTTAHTNTVAQAAVKAVTAAPAAQVASWTKCDGTNKSPCPQADGDRACPASPDPDFDELHALVTLPIVQSGNEPYVTPQDDGDVALDGSGNASIVRSEQVCMALIVPHGTMPAAGWPLVVYAHGTGGSFRSMVGEGVAAMLAKAKDSTGATTPIAVLGIDQVEHGTRRGASTDSPDNLFFNFTNPHAARGNPIQGAADQATLVKLAASLTIDASVDGAAIKFGKVAFWGHSQGATEGALAMPYVDGVTGVVLSGEGASLVDALMTKKNPVDVADVVPIALEDPSVDVYHPALAIFQAAIDQADPVNHAIALAAQPPAKITPKHVFQPYGLNDTYAPPATEQTYAIAARLGVAESPSSVGKPDSINGQTPLPVPASGNMAGATPITALVREYQPQGYDGHFVAFKDPDAMVDVPQFLADALEGKVPKVGH